MKKSIAVFLVIMLAMISIPVMANEPATQGPPVMATITAGMALPVSLSVEAAPLVKAIEAYTRSVTFGFLALVSAMIGISFALYFERKPVTLVAEFQTSMEPQKSPASKPEAVSRQSEIPKKPRKSGSKKEAATPVA